LFYFIVGADDYISMWSLFVGLHGVILTHLLPSGNSVTFLFGHFITLGLIWGHALTDGISDGEIHPLGVSKKTEEREPQSVKKSLVTISIHWC
jgi:hypothetical protein